MCLVDASLSMLCTEAEAAKSLLKSPFLLFPFDLIGLYLKLESEKV